MKKTKFVKVLAVASILLFGSSIPQKSNAGPFGKCGAWVIVPNTDDDMKCIYHFFRCDCLLGGGGDGGNQM